MDNSPLTPLIGLRGGGGKVYMAMVNKR